MKLLLDENLSFRLCRHLSGHFEDVRHVRDFHLLQTDDRLIWDFAKDNGYTIVTQDQDFVGRVVVDGTPPKIVWVRLSNAPVSHYVELLLKWAETITKFILDPNAEYIEVPTVPLV